MTISPYLASSVAASQLLSVNVYIQTAAQELPRQQLTSTVYGITLVTIKLRLHRLTNNLLLLLPCSGGATEQQQHQADQSYTHHSPSIPGCCWCTPSSPHLNSCRGVVQSFIVVGRGPKCGEAAPWQAGVGVSTG